MKTKLTEQKIQKRLNTFFASWHYNVDGLFVFGWESDKLIWTNAGYVYEFEIKISRSDFRNDFKHKPEKHLLLNSALPDEKTVERKNILLENIISQKKKRFPNITMEQAMEMAKPVGDKMPNYFYYAVPEGMLQPEEIPPYAGLVYIGEETGLRIIRKAPKLHETKYSDAELNLGEKFYYNMKTWQKNYREQVKCSLMYRERLQHELDSKNQEKSYKELQDELQKATDSIRYWREDSQKYYGLYMTMVEGADYNTIERRLLLKELKVHGVDVEKRYAEIMTEAERRYEEQYGKKKRTI